MPLSLSSWAHASMQQWLDPLRRPATFTPEALRTSPRPSRTPIAPRPDAREVAPAPSRAAWQDTHIDIRRHHA